MKSLKLEGTLRTETGKTAAGKLRAEEKVLCNLYGGGHNIEFTVDYGAFNPMVHSPEFFTVDLEIDGKNYPAIIKDVQYHPVTDQILHVDFLELVPDKAVTAEIPLSLVGLAMGVRNGGKLMQKMRRLRVKAVPANLVEKIELNVEKLRLGKSIKVREISVDGIEILNPAANPVASVEIPRALRGGDMDEEEEEGEEGSEGAEGAEAAAETAEAEKSE